MTAVVGNVALLVVVVIVGSLYASGGSSARDQLITDMLVDLILVLGLQVFVGNTGVLSFGHLGFASISAYTAALLAIPADRKAVLLPNAPWGIQDVEISIAVATFIGIGAAAVVAVVLGVVVARTSGLAATMITLAFLFVVEAVTKSWTDLTNGAGNLSSVPRLESRTWVTIAAVTAIVVAAGFRHTTTGRLAQAAREDELAAGAMGVDVRIVRFVALVVSAVVVGLGGSLRTQSLGTISPSQFSFDLSILVLAMLVVGGMRTVSGAIAGTLLVTGGKELFRLAGDGPTWLGVDLPTVEGLPDLFLAGVLLAVLLRRPSGLLGDWDAEAVAGRLWRTRSATVPAPTSAAAPTAVVEATRVPVVGRRSTGPLRAEHLRVSFGGFVAVDDVSLHVEPGQIRGLIGPNGAGKTTVVNMLTGIVAPTGGTVFLGDEPLAGAPFRIARAGLTRTFQNLRVFPALTVRENIAVAALVAARHRAERPSVDVDELLTVSGLGEVADRPARTLDYGNQRRLEIARATALLPAFLLLDEPTSGMSDTESQAMVGHVRRVAAMTGAGVLVIDHDLGFITSICDRITVLDRGRVLAEGSPDEVRRDPLVISAYLGSQA